MLVCVCFLCTVGRVVAQGRGVVSCSLCLVSLPQQCWCKGRVLVGLAPTAMADLCGGARVWLWGLPSWSSPSVRQDPPAQELWCGPPGHPRLPCKQAQPGWGPEEASRPKSGQVGWSYLMGKTTLQSSGWTVPLGVKSPKGAS